MNIDKTIPLFNADSHDYTINDIYYDKNNNIIRLDVSYYEEDE